MVDRPFLFSGAMVRALLAGTKTQTRRVITFDGAQNVIDFVRVAFDKETGAPVYEMKDAGGKFLARAAGKGIVSYHYSPSFAVGDRLYVREAWRVTRNRDEVAPRDLRPRTLTTFFEAGGSMGGVDALPKDRPRSAAEYVPAAYYPRFGTRPEWVGRLRAGMHMPRWASRLTLTVTDVRVQRLQEISPEDAQAEGVERMSRKVRQFSLFGATAEERARQYLYACVWEYEDLWNSLNEARGFGWDVNPWVVAVSFTAAQRNIDAEAPQP